MRITHAWASVAHTNSFLKIVTVSLVAALVVSVLVIGSLASNPALVIERSCISKVATFSDKTPTDEEKRAFLKEALQARFNYKEGNSHLLSLEELKKRTLEQNALSKQGMRQRIFVEDDNIKLLGSHALVEINRFIEVRNIKSVIPLLIKVQIANSGRSQLNPYGLVVTTISEATNDKKGGK